MNAPHPRVALVLAALLLIPLAVPAGAGDEVSPAPGSHVPGHIGAALDPAQSLSRGLTSDELVAIPPMVKARAEKRAAIAGPYTGYMVQRKEANFPGLWALGALFVTWPDGAMSQCSGTVVRPNVVVTAGHCLYNEFGEWIVAAEFIPKFDGDKPCPGLKGCRFGVWDGDFAWVLAGFDGNYASTFYDIGALHMVPQGGDEIGDVVGWLGVGYNYDPFQHFHLYGYPANLREGRPHTCHAQLSDTETEVSGEPEDMYVGCDMGGGSSGGPWVIDFGYKNENLVVGVNCCGPEGGMWSGPFTNDVRDMIEDAEAG
jgi:V8-like Glu-specific endopeptidase